MRRILLLAGLVLGSATALDAVAEDEPTLAGSCLVAREGMADPRFRESVVLLLRHGGDGAFGVVVNRPTDLSVSDVLPELEGAEQVPGAVYVGGPVMPSVGVALFRSASASEALHVTADLYMTMSRDVLEALPTDAPRAQPFRLFLGHAGWAPGQLEHELARGDWSVVPTDVGAILADDLSGLWRQLRAGGRPSPSTPTEPVAPPGARWTRLEAPAPPAFIRGAWRA